MPRVGGKHFPYTEKGKKAAARKEREEMKRSPERREGTKPKKGKRGY